MMKAIINTEVAVNNVRIIKTPNHQCNYVKKVFSASYTVAEATLSFSSSSSSSFWKVYLSSFVTSARTSGQNRV
jgi:hypothetical protein